MAEAASAEVVSPEEAEQADLSGFDVIGLGSGIYFGKHSKKIMDFAEKHIDRRVASFVFSTSGTAGFDKNNRALAELLRCKSRAVLGTFGCLGHDEFAIFKLVGGLNKGRPDGTDMENARRFMMSVAERYEKLGSAE